MRAFFTFLAIGLIHSAAQSGAQSQDSDPHREKPNYVASSLSDVHRVRGCGAGEGGADVYDQATCGNYAGAPYEDLNTKSATSAPQPFGSGKIHELRGCASVTPSAGDVWRLVNDIDDRMGGTNQNCIQFPRGPGNYVLDLAGHTLIGGISFRDGGFSGVTIVNGHIICNIANGGGAACLKLYAEGSPSKSLLLSHLTIENQNAPTAPDGNYSGFEFVIYLEAAGATPGLCPAGADQRTFNKACLQIAHVTTTPAAGYTGAGYKGQWCGRCTNIWVSAAEGNSLEIWNTLTACGGFVDACQGIVVFAVGSASIHNNSTANWTRYVGKGDNGRAFLFDSAGKAFNLNCKSAFNNLIVPFNNRAFRTRQEGCVAIHDNLLKHVEGGSTIQEGLNDDYSEKLTGNTISNNTFSLAGGTGLYIAHAYGVVVDKNKFICESNCSSVVIAKAAVDEDLAFPITSANRTAACVVTLNLTRGPSTTSRMGGLFVNVSGTNSDLDVSSSAGNTLVSRSGTQVTYVQKGCAGPGSSGPGGILWIAQNSGDNFPANGAELYIKNSIIDPKLTNPALLQACGQQGSINSWSSGFNPQAQSSGQPRMRYCNNTRGRELVVPVAGTGALVKHETPDSACP